MKDQIIDIIAKQLDIDAADMSESTLIIEDLGADSLDIIEILSEIEDTLNVTVPDEDIPGMKTVGDIIKYIEEH